MFRRVGDLQAETWQTGDAMGSFAPTVMECQFCKALVDERSTEGHLEWHRTSNPPSTAAYLRSIQSSS